MNKKRTGNIKPHLWEKSYPENLNWAFHSTDKPVQEILETATVNHGERTCVDFLGREFSYDDIMEMTNSVAKGLQEIGVKKGDRIGICLPNCPYFIAAYFGILKAGGTVVNFNPLYTEDELEYQINDSGVKTMLRSTLKVFTTKSLLVWMKLLYQSLLYVPFLVL